MFDKAKNLRRTRHKKALHDLSNKLQIPKEDTLKVKEEIEPDKQELWQRKNVFEMAL
ncbi:hypothetical protein DPMN_008256 [Dreissena polymorpha]|uniref:Uncharacterized protein n=1 Tax=Dreissena polymorpha TaxID=45954 RepID=A0A9D4N009_DREPO|nr:hypothetical protein DPMN_008256 [Dreissena polymorpha]